MRNRIIIYDDDKDILLVVSAILQMAGYEVSCREHCQHIQQDLETFQPSVILMDNWLPDMGGVRATQYIKSLDAYKHIPIIFFSANSSVEELAAEAGADYLLKKPFEMAELQQIIGRAIGNAKLDTGV